MGGGGERGRGKASPLPQHTHNHMNTYTHSCMQVHSRTHTYKPMCMCTHTHTTHLETNSPAIPNADVVFDRPIEPGCAARLVLLPPSIMDNTLRISVLLYSTFNQHEHAYTTFCKACSSEKKRGFMTCILTSTNRMMGY